MKIGFPNNPMKNLCTELEWIGKNKFDYVDFFMEEPKVVPDKIDVKRIREIISKYGLAVVGHIPWYFPTGFPDKKIRHSAVSEAAEYFKTLRSIGASSVTIHTNWAAGKYTESQKLDFQIHSLGLLASTAKQYGIAIMLEPVGDKNDSLKNMAAILDAVDTIGLNLDIGHCNLFGRKPVDFIEAFHERMMHVHMHDNDGVSDLHLPLGFGIIDWKTTIKKLKKFYDGNITLEIFTEDRSFVLLSRKRLLRIWEGA